MDRELGVLAEGVERRGQRRDRGRAEHRIVLGVVPPDRRAELGPVGLRTLPRDEAVVGGARTDHVGAGAGQHERKPAAHAEAHDADAGRCGCLVGEQEVDGAAHLLGRLADVERHHQLAGLVGLGRGASAVQIRRQGTEPGGGEAVAHALDVGHEPPPLLDHDDARPATIGWCVVPVPGAAVGFELDHVSQGAEP